MTDPHEDEDYYYLTDAEIDAGEYIGDELYPCQQAGRHVPEAAEYHSSVDCPFAVQS